MGTFANCGSVQRYEGASTLYGPHTLEAYINRTLAVIPSLGSIATPNGTGPLPPDNSNRSLSFIPGVVYDGKPWFRDFGDVKIDVSQARYQKGQQVMVTFVGANPRNDLRLEHTYAAVEFRNDSRGDWKRVRDDSDWGLIFYWKRTSELLGTSEVTIVWEIEDWAQSGEYRLRYYGNSKAVGGQISAFDGVSQVFRVV